MGRNIRHPSIGYPCLTCGTSTDVVDSRSTLVRGVRRRRACPNCGARFTTYEGPLESPAPTAEIQAARAALAQCSAALSNLVSKIAKHPGKRNVRKAAQWAVKSPSEPQRDKAQTVPVVKGEP